MLKKIGVSQIQITLDETKETHNKVKFLPSGDSYTIRDANKFNQK